MAKVADHIAALSTRITFASSSKAVKAEGKTGTDPNGGLHLVGGKPRQPRAQHRHGYHRET